MKNNNLVNELQNRLDKLENDVYFILSNYAILIRDIDYIHYRFQKLREELNEIIKVKNDN